MTKDIEKEDKHDEGKGGEEVAGGSAKEKLLAKLDPILLVAKHNAPAILAVIAISISLVTVFWIKGNLKELSQAASKVDTLTAQLASSKAAFDKYQATIMLERTQERLLLEQQSKKNEEVIGKIIQSVTQQQVKMKISPTLADVLQAGSAVQPASTIAEAKILAAPGVAPVSSVKVETPAPKKPEKKFSKQGQSIKDAIQKFNE